MKKLLSIALLSMLFMQFAFSQSDCKVKLQAINKTYKGECKKGYANGQGEASGDEDSYKGMFKKGMPHGNGTYIWGNGNIYVGGFVKGKMDGKGKLTLKDESGKITVQQGFFEKGNYIGEYKRPYAVISKREVKNVIAREDPSINTLPGVNAIKISFRYMGRQITPMQVNVSDSGKSLIEQEGNYTIMKNVKFPNKKIEIIFRTQQGHNGRVTMDIYKKGNWSVEISI